MTNLGVHTRNMKYEFVRVVAMFFVIAVHVIGNMPTDTPARLAFYYAGTLIFYTCNGLFFFVSGKFALESSVEIIKYYKKKICNIILPMLFYMAIKHIYLSEVMNYNDNSFMTNVMGELAQTDYWFLYVLMGNIFLAPIIRKAFVEANDKELRVFIFLGVSHCALATYLPYLGVNYAWAFPLGGWTLYFFMGYCVERLVNSGKKEMAVILLGAICFLISYVQKYYGLLNGIHDTAPTYIAITCGMYCLLKKMYDRCINNQFFLRAIKICGKHSFAVYMLHSIILTTIMRSFPFGEGSYVVYLITITCSVAFLSLMFGWICDKLIERISNMLYEKLV